ncbi:hypothetical protein FNF31_06539 [Cafeteria roenbergensis]|uniref:RNA ligase domain-containing protein n=1 Tax=Cafeteria roenbergensis TaxID=33653 RepID=A0A5A8DL98_CAFRO|nr:hypothetical protein FNF31_06539 [Cafeteria roenbergensis]KAA0164591.1 hypothetical protein FNF28_03750 [Cafeteria roenbergensis]
MASDAAAAAAAAAASTDPAFSKYEKMSQGELGKAPPPSAQFFVHEKIHGANLTVICTADGVRFAKRTGLIKAMGEAFFDYQTVASWLRPRATALFETVKRAFEAAGGAAPLQVDIVGELYGGAWPGPASSHAAPVQSKPLVFYSPAIEFAAFDLAVTPAAGSARKYVDWPVASVLLERHRIPTAPCFGLAPVGKALAWPLPFDSAVPAHLGHPLPEAERRGRPAEGVVVKCEVEARPLPLALLFALAESAGLTSRDGSPVKGAGADVARWAARAAQHRELLDRMFGDDQGGGCEAAGSAGAESGAGAEAAAPPGASVAARRAQGIAASERKGTALRERFIAKVKDARFKEVDKSGSGFKPDSSFKVPRGMALAVHDRLTEARLAAAQSKVGAAPAGVAAWIHSAVRPLGGGDVAEPEGGREWALQVCEHVMTDLMEELLVEEADGMGSCYRKPVDVGASGAAELVKEVAAKGEGVGLPAVLALAAAAPTLMALAALATDEAWGDEGGPGEGAAAAE